MTTITDTRMASDQTSHIARRVQLAPERWRASWCPEKLLTRSQSVTAMLLAELIGTQTIQCTSPGWSNIDQLAAELDLVGIDVAMRVLNPPHVLDRRLHMMSTTCWCDPAAALDGHINEDGSDVDFAATDDDPVDADGYLVEVLAR